MTRLCVGAVSKNVVQAACEAADNFGTSIDIIPSRRQVDTDGGYIGLDQLGLVNFVGEHDPRGLVRVCRDHGGPLQGSETKCASRNDAMESFVRDVAAGFKALHIDVSAAFKSSRRAHEEIAWYLYALGMESPDVRFEIGAEAQDGNWKQSIRSTRTMLEFLDQQELLHRVDYVVVQTGARVVEMQNTLQVTDAHDRGVAQANELCKEFMVGLKEHNGDYLTPAQLRRRRELGVAGVNIAPEYGVVETSSLLYESKNRKREDVANAFLTIAYNSRKWVKWMAPASTASELHRAVLAGHYVFEDPRVIELKAELGDDIDEALRYWVGRRIVRHLEELSG